MCYLVYIITVFVCVAVHSVATQEVFRKFNTTNNIITLNISDNDGSSDKVYPVYMFVDQSTVTLELKELCLEDNVNVRLFRPLNEVSIWEHKVGVNEREAKKSFIANKSVEGYWFVSTNSSRRSKHFQVLIVDVRNTSKVLYYTKTVMFDCTEYVIDSSDYEVYVAWIDTKSSNVTTIYNTTYIHKNFTAKDNGTALACVRVIMLLDPSTIFRPTLLMYDYGSESRSSNTAIVAWVCGAVMSVALMVVVRTAVCVYKRLRNKRTQQRLPRLPTLEVNNFYLNLLFRDQCQREIEALELAERKAREEHIYEEIRDPEYDYAVEPGEEPDYEEIEDVTPRGCAELNSTET